MKKIASFAAIRRGKQLNTLILCSLECQHLWTLLLCNGINNINSYKNANIKILITSKSIRNSTFLQKNIFFEISHLGCTKESLWFFINDVLALFHDVAKAIEIKETCSKNYQYDATNHDVCIITKKALS